MLPATPAGPSCCAMVGSSPTRPTFPPLSRRSMLRPKPSRSPEPRGPEPKSGLQLLQQFLGLRLRRGRIGLDLAQSLFQDFALRWVLLLHLRGQFGEILSFARDRHSMG